MFVITVLRFSLVIAVLLPFNYAFSAQWHTVVTPSRTISNAIGFYTNGCLAGGVPLALSGEGYQVIRTSRNRFYGHGQLIEFITRLAKSTQRAGLDDLLIADMSMPRGGSFTSGHASHQIGLDVDIWLKTTKHHLSLTAREIQTPIDVVDQTNFKIKTTNWDTDYGKLIEIAAKNPEVARIFVNPVIKQQLCDAQRHEKDWLHKVRPWWGHTYHIHVRLVCPQADEHCKNQLPPALDNGCNEINWWRNKITVKKVNNNKKRAKKTKKLKPEQCLILLNE